LTKFSIFTIPVSCSESYEDPPSVLDHLTSCMPNGHEMN